MRFNVNSSAVVRFSYRLEKLRKTALPTAVRYTLNDTVFDVKTRTMPESASKEFTQRQKNFFTANSKFESAKGMNIRTMQATVGFFENRLANQGSNYAVQDLQEQEQGGKIDSKSFIPTKLARTGNNSNKNVRANARLKQIRQQGIVNAKNQNGKSKADKFFKAVFKAGPGGYVLGNDTMGENFLWRVNSLSTVLKTKKLDITPLYDYSKGRSVKVKRTEFMREASLRSGGMMVDFYMKQATRQLKKYYGKL